MTDQRYTITQEQVDEARKLLALGYTKADISRVTGMSRYQVYYWTNEEARKRIREKNAKRIHDPGDKERIAVMDAKRKENWKNIPNSKLAHQISSAIAENRVDRKTVQGIEIEEAKALRDSGALKIPNAKIK